MDPAEPPDALVDFMVLRRRLATVVVPLAGACLLGIVVEGVIRGLTFALMARWAGIFAVLGVLGAAVATGLHALSGADRAGRRGERLSSPDVGLTPRRLAEDDETS